MYQGGIRVVSVRVVSWWYRLGIKRGGPARWYVGSQTLLLPPPSVEAGVPMDAASRWFGARVGSGFEGAPRARRGRADGSFETIIT